MSRHRSVVWAGRSRHSAQTVRKTCSTVLLLLLVMVCIPVRAERIKDIVEIHGVRGNPLTGVGLVIGLAGTGDTGLLSRQMLTNILRESGLVLSPSELTGGNIAVVMVTAELGPFDREGMRIDVDVSALGNAKSLQGAMLFPTLLKGLDGQVYAVAQGGISLGGWSVAGNQASLSKNHQTVGRIPGGAIVEKSELASFIEQVAGRRFITFSLRNNDFSTAQRISEIINQSYVDSAVVLDAASIKVMVPAEVAQKAVIAFLDEIMQKEVTVDMPATVVINERTGTIVVGESVSISSVAISQGSLVVKVKETAQVSQPMAPFSEAGSTQVIPETMVGVEEQNAYLIPVERAVTVSELAKALNAIGASPRDLIAIFNALKEAGALQAKLVIM
ncbi:MAG: flagellar basal body P-ring protein FlgI [Sedimentisphaerales bacterium]|nr:flagellar basal body P-ring protein FlgI [Sedimentisphaerales bacterium]HNY79307.1 flagellar basal body P-ring protein FlgI [Sedimentisphaerales bacterium]HOC64495.1 flagellar basal body P-ring protein FlgI [Sedimentisphaerales bacterium]HOH63358.1 flagellar basal body P-ring protein FlgI [Sedimentisphaerales bacterium]HPY48542.1 flagellar basal body P-ring protein FlgI [Sedimentisphaerales bacterium]